MRIGYADPPYIGCAHLYPENKEVDHAALIDRLESEFDGWVLHAAATPRSFAILGPLVEPIGARWCSWRKGFAAFKKNVPVGYAWEPVIIKACRKPVVSKRLVMRDWINTDILLNTWWPFRINSRRDAARLRARERMSEMKIQRGLSRKGNSIGLSTLRGGEECGWHTRCAKSLMGA